MAERNSGLLLHITSLPGEEGTGTMGKEAFRFVDFLEETGQTFWQILPVGPTGFGNSPYMCYSAFAGNPLLIDLKLLIDGGLLPDSVLNNTPKFSACCVDFHQVNEWKFPILREAFVNFKTNLNGQFNEDYSRFLEEHSWWLFDYALFIALKNHFSDLHWSDWKHDLKFRNKNMLNKFSKLLSEEIEFQKFIQFLFFRQWFGLKEYANSRGVKIFGDMPLYVSGDSVDVWSNPSIFMLDEHLKPMEAGGVPPDYFSETGQLWGNPVFDWEKLEQREFDWWLARLHFNKNLFDIVRIDHFRGLESFWSVPAGEKTAINGMWRPAKGFQLLEKFRNQIGHLPLVAEDLGVITPEVERLRDDFHLPGMKVLQFAFSDDAANGHLPHNYLPEYVAYTGTHDNDTFLGWMRSLKKGERKMALRYLGRPGKRALQKGVEQIWASSARTAIMPVQDLLGLGSDARFNTPGVTGGNWAWRFRWKQLKKRHRRFLKEITQKYNR